MPQGTILRPNLFNIRRYNIPTSKTDLLMFTDDAAIEQRRKSKNFSSLSASDNKYHYTMASKNQPSGSLTFLYYYE